MTNETDKVMDRIRKLLAMAGDTSSPNEAAIAARRARKLMDDYQISEMDLTTVDSSDMGMTDTATGHKNSSSFHGRLAVAVADLNDVNVGYARNRVTGKLDLRFKGMLVDTVCATEMFRYLAQEAYKQAERREQGRADRHAYRLGFASGVASQVREILKERNKVETATGQALVVCKKALVTEHYGKANYSRRASSFSGDRSSFQSGKRAGQKAGLGRQVTGQQQRRIAG